MNRKINTSRLPDSYMIIMFKGLCDDAQIMKDDDTFAACVLLCKEFMSLSDVVCQECGGWGH